MAIQLYQQELNVRLFNQVIQHIKKNPKRLWMPWWGILKDHHPPKTPNGINTPKTFPECGTVACLAGWTVLLSTPEKDWGTLFRPEGLMESPNDKAADLLGLSRSEASVIFGAGSETQIRKKQRESLFAAIKRIRRQRIEAGEKSAAKIKL